ncbi:MAG TPA: hypothetical protein DD643_07285 [Synechococcus sp. UBA8638]|nr:hypothetical protein [Synechococcus sp. UBA8638]
MDAGMLTDVAFADTWTLPELAMVKSVPAVAAPPGLRGAILGAILRFIKEGMGGEGIGPS